MMYAIIALILGALYLALLTRPEWSVAMIIAATVAATSVAIRYCMWGGL